MLLASALPGALAGAHLAAVLFFLNPDLPFDWTSLARGIIHYSPRWALLSCLLHLPWTWRNPYRSARLLPWSLSLVLAMIAVLAASHASFFGYYLPGGINRRLIKAGIWLTLGSLVAFYTALLHSLHRRRYGWRSCSVLWILGLGSLFVSIERREAFHPRSLPEPLPAAVERVTDVRLCVVGLDAATLDAVLPLAEQGHLPFFADLLGRGAYCRLTSLTPTRRDPLWTTLATGKHPFRHGIVGHRIYSADLLVPGGELRLLPAGLALPVVGSHLSSRPAHRSDRRALVLWEILPRVGVATGVVGWPSTSPVPEELSFGLSERFFQGIFNPANARPRELAERALRFRLDPEELDPSLVQRFGPTPPSPLLDALAHDLWRESLTLFLLEQRPDVEALFLLLPGLRSVSQMWFGAYAAQQLDGRHQPNIDAAASLLRSYYHHLDGYLAELWARWPPPRLMVVVSPHGSEPAGSWLGWMSEGSDRAVRGSFEHGPDGMLLIRGEGIRAGAFLKEAALVDLVPTLLYCLGLPVASDLDGRVLTELIEPERLARFPLTFVPSYELPPDVLVSLPEPSPSGNE